jgi:hypothetical protein
MNRRVMCCVLFAAMVSMFGFGCGDDDAAAGLITLSAVTPDPVPVTVGLATGTMTFDFSAQPLSAEHQDDFATVLYTGGIGLVVTSTDTGVNFALTQGTAVSDTPNAAGEYNVVASEDGMTVTVTFFNEFSGYSINTANAYTATVDVIENGYFTVETFTRGVSVL